MACAVAAAAVGCSTDGSPPRGGSVDTEQVRYLALGDSLTQGVGAGGAGGAFPALLAARWRTNGCRVELQNAGIGGYTSSQILADEAPRINSFEPTIVTFQAGVNDIVTGVTLDEYRKNINAILTSTEASGARVIVIAQNEWFRSLDEKALRERFDAQRSAFDSALIEEASLHGAEFVDLRRLYAEQAEQGQWVEDGHPTPEAYEAWAAKLSEAVPAPCKS
jgi:acyl-CoA thioesterase I